MATVKPVIYHSRSPEETKELAEKLAPHLHRKLVCLFGDLGAGKTTFTKGLAHAWGIPEKSVKSPTFVIQHEYQGRDGKLYHLDCYRITEAEQMAPQIAELLDRNDGTIIIEWAENVVSALPEERIEIHFEHLTEGERSITLHQHP